jgi:tetratricopeptide (TPR) repeat protein
MTQEGAILGTLPYMSPEQYAASHDVTVVSDVYSFGVVLYEMLTGQRPFEAGSYVEWRRKHLEELPRAPSKISRVPEELSGIAMRCLQKRPGDRFKDFAELGEALASYARSAGRSTLIPVPPALSELEAKMSASDWSGRGCALGQLGDDEGSYDSYKRALDMDPGAPGCNLNVGASIVRLGRRVEEALSYFEKETQIHPDLSLAFDALSHAYLLAERVPEAFTACRKAAELAPDQVELWRKYAIAARGIGSISSIADPRKRKGIGGRPLGTIQTMRQPEWWRYFCKQAQYRRNSEMDS